MKVRWTEGSVRYRITPSELAALERAEQVCERLRLPDGSGWSASVSVHDVLTVISGVGGAIEIRLSRVDFNRLNDPEEEGVYFYQEGCPSVRYYVEKDFPCAHPRSAELLEAPTETFAPVAQCDNQSDK